MSHGRSTDTFILLGGALLGAAAMYVLDPETGARRRRRFAAAAENACDQARDVVGETWKQVAGRAGDSTAGLAAQARDIAAELAHRARESLPDTGEAARNWGGSVFDRARNLRRKFPSSLHDRMEHVHDHAADRIGEVRRRVGSWIGQEEPRGFGTGTVVSSTVGCLAVGAGAMYFFDPQRGRTRRAWVTDKTGRCIHKTAKMLRATGRDLSNHLRGMAHGTTSLAHECASQARIDSEQLIQLIRAELGHHFGELANVQFMADAAGAVTITGNIACDELDRLLMVLHRVPGVTHVINRLNIADAARPEASNRP